MLTTLRANAWKYTAIAATLGLGAMLLVQTIRLADAEKDALTATTNLANERGAHERAAREQAERFRNLEGNHRDEIAKIDTTAQAAIDAAAGGRDRAIDARNRLRGELADYLAQHRAAAQARAAAGQCAPDTSPAALLAELQRRADERAGELAHVADTARLRGLACERSYDNARAVIDAAGQPQ